MKKPQKQSDKLSPIKKWGVGAAISIVVIPALTLSWRNIQSIWASPERLGSVEKKVQTQDDVQTQLSKLVLEQESRLERNEAVYQANLASTKEQLALIAEIKKYKK